MRKNFNPTALDLHAKPKKKHSVEKFFTDNKLLTVCILIVIVATIATRFDFSLGYNNYLTDFFKDFINPTLSSFMVGIFASMYVLYQQRLEDDFLQKKVYPPMLQEWADKNYDIQLNHYEAIKMLTLKDYPGALEDFTMKIPNNSKPEYQEFGTVVKTVDGKRNEITLVWDKNMYRLTAKRIR